MEDMTGTPRKDKFKQMVKLMHSMYPGSRNHWTPDALEYVWEEVGHLDMKVIERTMKACINESKGRSIAPGTYLSFISQSSNNTTHFQESGPVGNPNCDLCSGFAKAEYVDRDSLMGVLLLCTCAGGYIPKNHVELVPNHKAIINMRCALSWKRLFDFDITYNQRKEKDALSSRKFQRALNRKLKGLSEFLKQGLLDANVITAQEAEEEQYNPSHDVGRFRILTENNLY